MRKAILGPTTSCASTRNNLARASGRWCAWPPSWPRAPARWSSGV